MYARLAFFHFLFYFVGWIFFQHVFTCHSLPFNYCLAFVSFLVITRCKHFLNVPLSFVINVWITNTTVATTDNYVSRLSCQSPHHWEIKLDPSNLIFLSFIPLLVRHRDPNSQTHWSNLSSASAKLSLASSLSPRTAIHRCLWSDPPRGCSRVPAQGKPGLRGVLGSVMLDASRHLKPISYVTRVHNSIGKQVHLILEAHKSQG